MTRAVARAGSRRVIVVGVLPQRPQPSTHGAPSSEWSLLRARADLASTRSERVRDWRDIRVAEVAARQHGVVSYAQLRAAGLTRDAIAHRTTHGRLTRLHRGVYLAGPITDSLTEPFAALLACGPTAALCHHTAGARWELLPPRPGPIHVAVTSGRPRHRGITVHRSILRPHEITCRRGLTLTTPVRTLIDLAALLPRRETERAVEAAIVRGLTSDHDLLTEAHAAGPRRGGGVLRAILADLDTPSLTRSEAERRLLALVRKAGLPHPVANARVGPYEVDLLWPRERLIVEVDGYAFHAGRQAFERDRARDAALQVAGYRVIRVTWRQIVREPHRVVATLAAALSLDSGW